MLLQNRFGQWLHRHQTSVDLIFGLPYMILSVIWPPYWLWTRDFLPTFASYRLGWFLFVEWSLMLFWLLFSIWCYFNYLLALTPFPSETSLPLLSSPNPPFISASKLGFKDNNFVLWIACLGLSILHASAQLLTILALVFVFGFSSALVRTEGLVILVLLFLCVILIRGWYVVSLFYVRGWSEKMKQHHT